MMEGWLSLKDLLNKIFVVGSGYDRKNWNIDPHGYFSVKSFCRKKLCVGDVPHVNQNIEG